MDYQDGCVTTLREPELHFIHSVRIHILQMGNILVFL